MMNAHEMTDEIDQEIGMMRHSKKINKQIKTETASRKSSLNDRLENLKLDKIEYSEMMT